MKFITLQTTRDSVLTVAFNPKTQEIEWEWEFETQMGLRRQTLRWHPKTRVWSVGSSITPEYGGGYEINYIPYHPDGVSRLIDFLKG